MVDQCKMLDVEESMSKKTWSTEEFNHVLRSYTDMVGHIQMIFTFGYFYFFIFKKDWSLSVIDYSVCPWARFHNWHQDLD